MARPLRPTNAFVARCADRGRTPAASCITEHYNFRGMLEDEPRVAVAIRQCRQPTSWRSRYGQAETRLADMPNVIWEALRNRFAPPDGSTSRPDLEFVPWACLLQPRATRPKLGSFTVFSGAWATFPLELFADTRAMCSAMSNCSSASLRGLAVLAIEAPSYLMSWNTASPEPTVNSSRLRSFPGGGGVFQIPYPTSEHYERRRGMPPAPELGRRTALAALVANVAGRNGTSGLIGRSPLRSQLHAECRAAPAGQCLAQGQMRGDSRIWNNNVNTTAMYRSSVFCLQPWGDSATRKGFWDAVLAGCINAVFNSVGWNETDAWFGDHRRWTVRVPLEEMRPGGRGALGFLQSLPKSEVARLHSEVASVRGRVQYAIEDGTPGGDGVDVLVRNLAEHFWQQRAAGNLPRMHSGENTCKELLGHICRQPTHPYANQLRPALPFGASPSGSRVG